MDQYFKTQFTFYYGRRIGIGVLQQITGINAIYFYATSIFKQTGIGTDAAFSSGILLSSVTVLFTFIAMYLIDRAGRRPLLLGGYCGYCLKFTFMCLWLSVKLLISSPRKILPSSNSKKPENLIPLAGNDLPK